MESPSVRLSSLLDGEVWACFFMPILGKTGFSVPLVKKFCRMLGLMESSA